jgi:hemolysin III
MTASEAFEVSLGAVRRRFSRWEMGVDGAIHTCAIIAAIVGAVILILFAASRGGTEDVIAVAIYSSGMLAMFGCSLAYNLARFTRHGRWLCKLDHAGIFLMIAGTYTPFTLLALQGAWSWTFTCLVWSVALLGILLRLVHGRLFDRLSLGLYLVLGWIALAAVGPLAEVLNVTTMILLATGGALYTIGIVFHLWERLPFQTAIWHLFVVAGAATHFAAVVVGLVGTSAPT